jgi:hypothetical protein
MCKWCLTRRPFTKWGLSHRDINEWTGNDADIISHFFQKTKYRAIHLYHQSKKILKPKFEKQNEN